MNIKYSLLTRYIWWTIKSIYHLNKSKSTVVESYRFYKKQFLKTNYSNLKIYEQVKVRYKKDQTIVYYDKSYISIRYKVFIVKNGCKINNKSIEWFK